MKTNDLISQLSTNLTPVKRLAGPGKRFSQWLLAMALCLMVSLTLRGVREDLPERLEDPLFLISLLLLLTASVVSAMAAFILSVPGEERPWAKVLPFSALGLWIVVVVLQALSGTPLMISPGWGCSRDIILLGALPGALLFWMVRSAAPLSLDWTGAIVMLSLGAIGAFGVQLGCHDEGLVHVMLWHFLPVLILGFVGVFLGRKLLKTSHTYFNGA